MVFTMVEKTGLNQQANFLKNYHFSMRVCEQGMVISVGDGVMWVSGLPSAALSEIVLTEDGSLAQVFMLSPDRIGAILLEESSDLRAGAKVSLTGRELSVKTGDALLGRVVDPLGNPLDGKPMPECHDRRKIERPSPPITDRDFVSQPLYTGNKIADSMIPIGHGQRQLLIGDNDTGKTTFALDTIIHQRDHQVRCIYVLIGQRRSSIASVVETLRNYNALEYTTVVVAEATAMPGLKYIAPFCACTMAEHWMDAGQRVLVVYDDLSTHALIYRELSLLFRRPPGREAYPGDIFYLHSRLLERSTCLSKEKRGGSMTALAIVETEQGEISAYIPTNLISITDGQIYFDHGLFAAGRLPAIDVRRSVSRIGGKAQPNAIKQEASRIKLDYLQFLELEMFSHFGAHLEEGVKQRLKRGRILRKLLQQDQQSTLQPTSQLAWLIAFNDQLFSDESSAAINEALDLLISGARHSPLTLDDSREKWSLAVAGWLGSSRSKSSVTDERETLSGEKHQGQESE